MRAILCPPVKLEETFGEAEQRGDEAELSLPLSFSLISHEAHPFSGEWEARVLHTRAHAHDRNRRRSRAILSRGHEKGKEEGRRERRATVARTGSRGPRVGPSVPQDARARERERKRERGKKGFVKK